jgi:hypothetical protein
MATGSFFMGLEKTTKNTKKNEKEGKEKKRERRIDFTISKKMHAENISCI